MYAYMVNVRAWTQIVKPYNHKLINVQQKNHKLVTVQQYNKELRLLMSRCYLLDVGSVGKEMKPEITCILLDLIHS